MERNLRETLPAGKFPDVESEISRKMRSIHSSGTKPEIELRHMLESILPDGSNIYFNHELPGRPDIFIPDLNLVIFCDGCFFHGCPEHGHIPKRNSNYWSTKIKNNQRRDHRVNYKLRTSGYSVWRIWEHHFSNNELRNRLISLLSNRVRKLLDDKR